MDTEDSNPSNDDTNGQAASQNVQPEAPQPPANSSASDHSPYRKLFVQILIGSLVAAAGLAVIAVLAGEFNDTLGKALFTLGLVTLHAFLSLNSLENSQNQDDTAKFKVFNATTFTLIVLSFFTSIFGVWELLPGDIAARLYGTYFVLLFASLHGEMLARSTGKDGKIDKIVVSNYVFMAIVILLLLPMIWVSDFEPGDFYFRLLAASAIVDATLTIIAVILFKLYLQKHPEEKSSLFGRQETTTDENGKTVVVEKKRGLHPLLWLLIIFIAFQFIGSIIFALLGSF